MQLGITATGNLSSLDLLTGLDASFSSPHMGPRWSICKNFVFNGKKKQLFVWVFLFLSEMSVLPKHLHHMFIKSSPIVFLPFFLSSSVSCSQLLQILVTSLFSVHATAIVLSFRVGISFSNKVSNAKSHARNNAGMSYLFTVTVQLYSSSLVVGCI